MSYIVTDNCQRCRFTDCVEVCPVDCFYADDTMLYIHPDECIDCGACEPACPVEAILPDDSMSADQEKWFEINRIKSESDDTYNITETETPLPTAEARKTELGL